jgi:acetyl-CoA carboxylase carboxyl transferase subunit beta
MTWLQKLLPPRIKSTPGIKKTTVPEGLWVKCPACEAVLYGTDLEKNLQVCPKCNHHGRVARERIEQLLDPRTLRDRISVVPSMSQRTRRST